MGNHERELKLLERDFENYFEGEELKMAAETAYALACILRELGNEGWREYALKACRIYKDMKMDSLSEIVPENMKVGSILLPNYLHDGIIMKKFGISSEEI